MVMRVLVLRYHDVYQPCKPVVLQQTRVPNSLLMGANYVDYEPQGTEVIQVYLQTTPKRGKYIYLISPHNLKSKYF